ncbi:hypothetical protein BKA70DRAFT_1291243 [Coprinopsis sp. MPI-PUGE-AT-0042]|nr:hypothetical protein BKA70DRAFT_1291243 [Coprinopsis sp. MPI-PUGE-AT-0042]
MPSIHVSSTPAIQIPPQGSYTSEPIYTNPHTYVSPPSSPIVASSSVSPANPSILHTQLSATPPPLRALASKLPATPAAPTPPVFTDPLRPCCPPCLPSCNSCSPRKKNMPKAPPNICVSVARAPRVMLVGMGVSRERTTRTFTCVAFFV